MCEGLRGYGLIKDKCQFEERRQGLQFGNLSNNPGWCPVHGKTALIAKVALSLEI